MKKYVSSALCLILILTAGCADVSDRNEAETEKHAAYEIASSVDMEKLKGIYPEFFETKETIENIDIYVWQMSENAYFCGLLCGTDTDKTEEEIWSLQGKAITVDETKALLNETGADMDSIHIYPTSQPYSSYSYEINGEYEQRVLELFDML